MGVVLFVIGLAIVIAGGRNSFVVSRGEIELRSWKRLLTWVGLFFFYMILTTGVGTVEAGERGVVLRNQRVTERVIEPGAYLVLPLLESVQIMDCKTQALHAQVEGGSVDMQTVSSEITLNYALDPAAVTKVYEKLRNDGEKRVISPAIQEAVKAATAKFKAEELITKRELVKQEIHMHLSERLASWGFTVDALNVTDFDFSHEFNAAIEQKTTALQLAAKAQNDLERVKMEAAQQVERAKAEAEALKAQREAVTPELIALRRTEALLKAIEKWDGRLPTTVMGGSNGVVPVMDVFQNVESR